VLERWEHYEDGGSGIGVRGFGDTAADAFEQAALALTATMTDPQGVSSRERVVIRCEAPTDDLLLATWLDAVRSRMKSSRMLFSRFEVWLDGTRLTAHAWGEPMNPDRHELRLQVKGARADTPHVARHGEGWMAQAIMEF
jgi:SHS2 domain-containing protein